MGNDVPGNWLMSALIDNVYGVALCTSQQEFDLHLNVCGLKTRKKVPFVDPGNLATGHLYEETAVGPVFLIGMALDGDLPPIEEACILVHEATHIWQAFCRAVGEKNPGDEIEAYSIQAISRGLMEAFAEAKAKRMK